MPDIDPAPGDAVLFHTGWGAHWDDAETLPVRRARPRHGARRAGWWSAASRSPAATPGATARSRPRTRTRPFEVPQFLNVRHGVFVVENLDTVGARARRRARVRADPDPPEAARRDAARGPRRSRWSRRTLMEHYDVIIIGTGAGGGTLAHRLAPSGKRILLLERGGYLPREPRELGLRGGLRPRAIRHHRALVRQARRRVPPARPVLRRRQHQGLRRRSCSACASATSTRSRHYGGVSPAWPISYAELEPYYAQAERLYLVHGAGRRGPDRAAALGPVPLPRRLPRAADPAAARRSRARPATGRSTCRSGSTSTNPTPKPAAAFAATASTASPA